MFTGLCAQRLLSSSDAGASRARLEELQGLFFEKEKVKKGLNEKRKILQQRIKELEAEVHDLETNKDNIVRPAEFVEINISWVARRCAEKIS